MMDSHSTRRTFAAALGTFAVGALAGCTGSGAEGDQSGGDGGESTPTETETRTATDAESSASGGGGASLDGWFEGVSNYDGVVDKTGTSEVTVAVGASGNNGNYAFDPAAVRVDAGTTVVWEWTGKGASHNVSAEDGTFESEMTDEEGHTFEHTFEEGGTHKYVCTPHKAMGMKGAVVVTE
ncbi:halocyanin domain-containing protein [Halopelagius longus]|uniref:Halocyanin domain-containing protein n=1 Tax=Halopelagius longus TaxID=1236180 RepID=A0A1H1FI45_9EURY|nr:halocyanin domain-containing protein [Halopelagius longus]RDI70089.1 halocyanin domain-containing protein [Halopelagius longus]SDR00621.1 halocyanin domain-containing protein [Halopelagius longus]